MTTDFNIKDLIKTAHGYVGLPFPALGLPNKSVQDINKIGTAITGKDLLGRAYFMDVVIDGLRLPNEPLVTISGSKKIQETIIVGNERNGTVKELISSNDYRIKIQGVCIDPSKKEYPQTQVENIIEVCKKASSLDFQNEYAELFGIYNVVITDYSFPPMKGKPYSQAYSITAVSNEDFYANLNNDLNAL